MLTHFEELQKKDGHFLYKKNSGTENLLSNGYIIVIPSRMKLINNEHLGLLTKVNLSS